MSRTFTPTSQEKEQIQALDRFADKAKGRAGHVVSESMVGVKVTRKTIKGTSALDLRRRRK